MPEIPDNLTPAERAVVNHASFVAAYNQFLRPHAVPARSGRGRIAGRRRPGAVASIQLLVGASKQAV